MSMSTSDSNHLTFLLNHGSTLAALERRFRCNNKAGTWKNTTKTQLHQQHTSLDSNKIIRDIHQILEHFEKASQGQSTLDKEGASKVMELLINILQQLINEEPHNSTDYSKLVDRINNLTIGSEVESSSSHSSFNDSSSHRAHNNNNNNNNLGHLTGEEEFDVDEFCENLGIDSGHKFVSSLFPIFSPNKASRAIKKKELINWWIGLELIDDLKVGDQVLRRLVAEEFIVAVPSCRYTLHDRVRSKMHQTATAAAGTPPFLQIYYQTKSIRRRIGYHVSPMDRLLVLYETGLSMDEQHEDKAVAAINNSAYTLNAKTFDRIFKMRNAKVVHLGSWHGEMDYVVMDDMIIPFLKELKNLKEARFLSFQGVARMQKIPNSVYSLHNLKVLDLRACQDLVYLPKGIESLQKLTHLDLSECYQLDYIPKGVSKLSELQVLKGFIINAKEVVFKNESSSCSFSELSKLEKLNKLSIRTRRMNFPTNQDIQTLSKMEQLNKLKVRWVRNSRTSSDKSEIDVYSYISQLPIKLKKLELQAAPELSTMLMLSLLGDTSNTSLEKLYIRGGRIGNLNANNFCFPNVKELRFRYLPLLHINWFQLKPSFPKLSRLEVFECPSLIFFPCNENGVWEESESYCCGL